MRRPKRDSSKKDKPTCPFRTWRSYCRKHGLKNQGRGVAKLYLRGTYTIEGMAALRPDGTVHFQRKDPNTSSLVDDPSFAQPSEEAIELFQKRYDDIRDQELPDPDVNVRITLPPDLRFVDGKVDWAEPLDTTRYERRSFYLYGGTGPDLVDMIEIRKDLRPDVAEREERGKGDSKQCIAWFCYNDREWRSGVPAGHDTPLFGDLRGGRLFMWHEGPKAASAATEAARFDSGHPWQGFLARFTHISHQGGAYQGAVENADWSMLNQEDVTLFLSPDNDAAGYEVAARIQKMVPDIGSLKIVHFGEWKHIPKSWDLADDWRQLVPPELKTPGMTDVELRKRAVPSETALKKSYCTFLWATDRVYDPDRDTMVPQVRPRFAKQFRHLIQTNELVEWDKEFGPGYPMDEKTFNSAYSTLHPAGLNLAAYVRARHECRKFFRPGYWPATGITRQGESDADGTYVAPPLSPPGDDKIVNGRAPLNMYHPTHVVERAPKANLVLTCPNLFQGKMIEEELPSRGWKWTRKERLSWRETEKSIRPFLVYLHHLIPNPVERKTLIRWACNNLTAPNPGARVPWAALLVSVMQGTGKTTLGTILSTLVGHHNVSNIDGSAVSESFNGWMENKQLAIVEEMKEESSFKLYEKLKAPISNTMVTIRKMHTDRYDSENFITLLAMSNHLSALSVPNDDRRWFFPKVTTRIAPEPGSSLEKMAARYLAEYARGDRDFFSEFYRWLADEGYSHLLWWMRRYGLKLHEDIRNWNVGGATAHGYWRTVFKRAP